MWRLGALVTLFVAALGFVLGYDIATTIPPPPAENFDPKEVRVISSTEISSACIGDNSTPICAAETFLVCTRLQIQALCDIVGVDRLGNLDREPRSLKYRIIRYKILSWRDQRIRIRNADWNKPGVARIVLYEDEYNDERCTENCHYFLRVAPSQSGWLVIDWLAEGQTL